MLIPKVKVNVEPALGPRAGDIGEPPFLLDLFGVAGGQVR